jgi:uncharacterized membrane protein YecN with MAPEG domain
MFFAINLINLQNNSFTITILISLLALLQTFGLDVYISLNKFKRGVQDPEIVNDETFKKVYKIYNNTVSDLILFLPLLWMFSSLESDNMAGLLGIIWLFGRFHYDFAFFKNPSSRTISMATTSFVVMTMFVWIFIKVLL